MAKKLDRKVSKLSLDADYFLHMLRDRKTEMYVKFAKVMVICQGPYTEDRLKMATEVEKIFKSSSRVLSDNTYRSEFKTTCSPDGTEEFFTYLKQEVKIALESGYNLIYIDTTLSNFWQNQYYIAAAKKMQYTVLVLPPVVTKKPNVMSWPKGSQADSFHKILKARIQAPNMFQHLFCGWFLHDIDSEELRNECALYANDLIENIPDFREWFSKGNKEEDVTFTRYFDLIKEDVEKKKLVMREDLAFCPVKVFENDFSMQEYFDKPIVREHYGRMSKLHIVGFVISPHMVAARVKLTHKQKELWEMDDKASENQEKLFKLQFPTKLYESLSELPPLDPEVKRICSKSNNTIVKADSVFDPTDLIPPFAKGRSAHIVLGTSLKASHADIDYGVAFALNREFSASKQEDLEIEVVDIGRSQVKRIGKYWIVYLKDTLYVNGFFASCLKPEEFDTPVQAQKKQVLFSKK
ncbi:2',3'-cyclic-nucleotide 3'-phosphodiesterase-like [Parasteatoda tepidariorum]|uniref:2',3'-cyclic-nucleotide 3'-phosphodiesterase-like n=1 Tax=Parasteatoda tepidariorum TaxID=114398 RepID=UPI0039BC6709